MSKEFKDHILTDQGGSEHCHTWLGKDPGTSVYFFRVTWVPGFLILTGDIGDVVTQHYNAMQTKENAIGWMRGADFSYWAEKTQGPEQIYCPESTLRALNYFLSEGIISQEEFNSSSVACESQMEWNNWLYNNHIDDFYGSYVWSDRMKFLHDALKWWAERA